MSREECDISHYYFNELHNKLTGWKTVKFADSFGVFTRDGKHSSWKIAETAQEKPASGRFLAGSLAKEILEELFRGRVARL
jgi:hypothetical protein